MAGPRGSRRGCGEGRIFIESCITNGRVPAAACDPLPGIAGADKPPLAPNRPLAPQGSISMAPLGNELDADFFNLIHQLAGAAGEDGPAERRRERRRSFLSSQRIAPRRGPGVPDESQFFEVPCHDLSRGGFSFFFASRPDFDSLAVAFGTPPEVIYMAAEVAHCEDVLVDSSGEVLPARGPGEQFDPQDLDRRTATPMVMVGCRFNERLHK